jgi:aspartyl-tRNA(Asn)/glutamyl-tRNA(Gln) amidotransferase subunit C
LCSYYKTKGVLSEMGADKHSQIDIGHLATLARLNLKPDECTRFEEQIGDILAYVDKLKQLNVDGVEPMATALPVINVFRDDTPHEMLSRDEAMRNAPDKLGAFFKVPRIIQNGEDNGEDSSREDGDSDASK